MKPEQEFATLFKGRVEKIDEFVESYFDAVEFPEQASLKKFREAVKYSVGRGGKRFRPLLALLVGEAFDTPEERMMPWAAAIEFVHSYSLIHDDLPCMDNDDLRRGKPTNHKIYGEAMALLAGDALLTESFFLVSEAYSDQPELARRLVSLLSMAGGLRGMVSGQVLDMHFEKVQPSFEELLMVHRLKTAQMIQLPMQGAGWICGAEESKIDVLRKFGEALGLAFQVADDIIDHDIAGQDNRSFTKLIGYKESKDLLIELSEEALFHLKKINAKTPLLHQMIDFNLRRHD